MFDRSDSIINISIIFHWKIVSDRILPVQRQREDEGLSEITGDDRFLLVMYLVFPFTPFVPLSFYMELMSEMSNGPLVSRLF